MIITASRLHKHSFIEKETICTILSDRKDAIEVAIKSIRKNRKKLEDYIEEYPIFQHTLEPIDMEHGPEVAILMEKAARKANVGPMAAVAGVLADLAVGEMITQGAKVAVVENGGEAFLMSDRPLKTALQAGDTLFSKRIGFELETFPIGVATSSGKFSHALSFGDSDAVTVFAESAGLADAVATAVGNVIKGDNAEEAVEKGIGRGLSIEGVESILILYGEKIGIGGNLPRIIQVDPKLQ